MSDDSTSGGGIVKIVAFLGWLAVIGGVCLIGYGIYALLQSDFGMAAGAPLLAGGATTAALGLLAIVNATMARAMIDTANNTARLLASGGAVAAATAATTDTDVPDFSATTSVRGKDEAEDFSTMETEQSGRHDEGTDDETPDLPPFEPAPAAPAPITPDMSDPRLWPLAVDEFDLDGHLAMTLEDGSIAVETPAGWARLPSLEDARTWLSQGG
jgi:hypothetical protein